jgi:hypothetical protein
VLKAHGITPKWSARNNYKGLSPECKAAYRRINLRWHDIRHEYASRLVERGVPLAQVRDLLGHASIMTTERYDNQRLENLQLAASKLERGLTFEPPAPEAVADVALPKDRSEHSSQAFRLNAEATKSRTKFQESFKYEEVRPRSHRVREIPALEPNELEDLNLSEWLGGRDSNPDNVVQRLGERSNAPRSGHILRALRAERAFASTARSRIPTNCHMTIRSRIRTVHTGECEHVVVHPTARLRHRTPPQHTNLTTSVRQRRFCVSGNQNVEDGVTTCGTTTVGRSITSDTTERALPTAISSLVQRCVGNLCDFLGLRDDCVNHLVCRHIGGHVNREPKTMFVVDHPR